MQVFHQISDYLTADYLVPGWLIVGVILVGLAALYDSLVPIR